MRRALASMDLRTGAAVVAVSMAAVTAWLTTGTSPVDTATWLAGLVT